jgi:hypothetical protein
MMAQTQAENAVDTRPKNFLTQPEITRSLKAARHGRHSELRNGASGLPARVACKRANQHADSRC